MKNLAQFKSRLQLGTKLHTTFHQSHAGRDENGTIILKDEDKGIREVSIVQSNSFALKTTKADGKIVDSWCSYPKATECKILDENTIQVYTEDFRSGPDGKRLTDLIPCLTYKFVTE